MYPYYESLYSIVADSCLAQDFVIIIAMSIIDILQHRNRLLALDIYGSLVSWNLEPSSSSVFPASHRSITPLQQIYGNSISWKLGTSQPICLQQFSHSRHVEKLFIICYSKELLIIKSSVMDTYLNNYENKGLKCEIPMARLGLNGEDITCLLVLPQRIDMASEDEQQDEEQQLRMLLGTRSGMLCSATLNINKLINNHSMHTQLPHTVKYDLSALRTSNPKTGKTHPKYTTNQHITAMIVHREDKQSILLGTSYRFLYPLNLLNYNIGEQLFHSSLVLTQINCNSPIDIDKQLTTLQPITAIFMNLCVYPHHFFTLHANYLVQWSFELMKCEMCYQYQGLKTVLIAEGNVIRGTQSVGNNGGACMLVGGDGARVALEHLSQIPAVSVKSKQGELPVENTVMDQQPGQAHVAKPACTIDTSVSGVTRMKELRNGRIAVGGTFGLIQLFRYGTRSELLYVRSN